MYFEYFRKLASIDNRFENDLVGLTKAVAQSGGIVKELFLQKNGKQVERAVFTKKFDDVLVSKWFLHFERVMLGVYGRHKELHDQWDFIVSETFNRFFKGIDLDRNLTVAMIHRYFNMTFTGRISQAIINNGSSSRMRRIAEGGVTCVDGVIKSNHRVLFKSAVNSMAVKLGYHVGNVAGVSSYDDCRVSDIVLDLSDRLKDNPYGKRLLEACLFSNKRVDVTKIDDFIWLSPKERTEDTKTYLVNAYNVIKKTLLEYLSHGGGSVEKYNKKPIKTVSYNEAPQK